MVRTTRKKHEVEGDFLKEEYMTATATTGSPVAGTFHSTVVGRSKMIDLTQDLGVRFGINRISVQDVFKIQDEQGPNGEPVFGVVNDKYNQIRFFGTNLNFNTGDGQFIVSYWAEITFYGTGLKMLSSPDGFTRNIYSSVDGGAESADKGILTSNVLQTRNYSANVKIPLESGLALGVHTVRLRMDGTDKPWIMGFEILNERTDLLVPKGGYYKNGNLIRNLTEQNIPYATGFTNTYGTLGTKGGCVAVYLDENGTLKKDIQWTDVAPQYFTSSDHSNEEITTQHNWREFGAGRTDDFSTLSSAAGNRAFTLDDGTTALVGQNVVTPDNLSIYASTGFITLTFVGTGLDLDISKEVAIGHLVETFIDGVSIGNIDYTLGDRISVCSGLPYGTHTVKFLRLSGATYILRIRDFIIYGPKKPIIADSSQEIGSYYLMADYVKLVGVSADSALKLSTGVLRKDASREFTYTGTWGIGAVFAVGTIGGWNVGSSTINDYFEYTFFGTGFDLGGLGGSNNVTTQLSIDGALYTGAATSRDGDGGASGSWTSGTSTWLTPTGFGSRLQVSGLALGIHTIKLEATAADVSNNYNISNVDIITPIHSPKLNGPNIVQNTLRVGSTAIGDSRVLKDEDTTGLIKANGIDTDSITSASLVPTRQMAVSMISKTGKIEISFETRFRNDNAGAEQQIEIWVDGKVIDSDALFTNKIANQNSHLSLTKQVNVSKGYHIITVMAAVTANTLTLQGDNKVLYVRDV